MDAFDRKKQEILKELARPVDSYSDRSPKGSVDAQIRELVDTINSYQGLVTTSSCSGRISVFVEGHKQASIPLGGNNAKALESTCTDGTSISKNFSKSGKGSGGRWLFVSHEPLRIEEMDVPLHQLFGLGDKTAQVKGNDDVVVDSNSYRLIHFKFEPLASLRSAFIFNYKILHILASDANAGHHVLAAAHQAGLRESGASNLEPDNGRFHSKASDAVRSSQPIPLAIRTTGIAFDNIIGAVTSTNSEDHPGEIYQALVSNEYLHLLVSVANDKFAVNVAKTRKFAELLSARFSSSRLSRSDWEDSTARKERKRKEGLERKQQMFEMKQAEHN